MKANLLSTAALAAICHVSFAQTLYRVPNPAPFYLGQAPDARSAGTGLAGTASTADANAAYWNAAKLTATESNFGASASYSPWLPYLVDGLWMGYATAYKKVGKGQAVGASVYYYDNVGKGNLVQDNGNDLTISGTYAKELGRHFSMGVTLKYISSRSQNGISITGNHKRAQGVAADISAFYRTQTGDESTGEKTDWTFGATLSNLGPKMDYGGDSKYFLPTTLRLGGGFSYAANSRHKLNLIADVSKLLVPTPNGASTAPQPSVFSGIWRSFSDAPGGFSEEMKEIVFGVGAEYWYKNTFALRTGYSSESKEKGARSFLTAGVGARFLKHYGLDFAYLFPTTAGSPFRDLYKISASVYF